MYYLIFIYLQINLSCGFCKKYLVEFKKIKFSLEHFLASISFEFILKNGQAKTGLGGPLVKMVAYKLSNQV